MPPVWLDYRLIFPRLTSMLISILIGRILPIFVPLNSHATSYSFAVRDGWHTEPIWGHDILASINFSRGHAIRARDSVKLSHNIYHKRKVITLRAHVKRVISAWPHINPPPPQAPVPVATPALRRSTGLGRPQRRKWQPARPGVRSWEGPVW